MLKKILALAVSVMIVLSCVSVMAEEKTTITVSSAECHPGDYVTLSIEIYGNTGFTALGLKVQYDSDALTPVSVSTGSLLDKGYTSSTLDNEEIDMSSLNYIKIFSASADEIKGDGLLYSVKFKAGNETGKTSVVATVTEDSFINGNYESISYERKDSIVNITENVFNGEGEEDDTDYIKITTTVKENEDGSTTTTTTEENEETGEVTITTRTEYEDGTYEEIIEVTTKNELENPLGENPEYIEETKVVSQTTNVNTFNNVTYTYDVKPDVSTVSKVAVKGDTTQYNLALNIANLGNVKSVTHFKVRNEEGKSVLDKVCAVTFGDTIETIYNSFNYCKHLKNIVIPANVKAINSSFIELSPDAVIYAKPGSYAEHYAKNKGVKVAELIDVEVNGKKLFFDQPATLINDRTLVPMRVIFEELGATVSWDNATETVTAVKDGKTIKLKIGSNIMTINGETKTLDVAAAIKNDRTMVPVRAVSESLGAKVDWDGANSRVIINK